MPDGHVINDYIAINYNKSDRDDHVHFLTHIETGARTDQLSSIISVTAPVIYTSEVNQHILQSYFNCNRRIECISLGRTYQVYTKSGKMFLFSCLRSYYNCGAIVLIMRGEFGSIIYTGSSAITYNELMVPIVKEILDRKALTKLFLDCTYYNNNLDFFTISSLKTTLVQFFRNKKNRFYIHVPIFGLEDVLAHVAVLLNELMVIDMRRMDLIKILGLSKYFTTDKSKGRLHIISQGIMKKNSNDESAELVYIKVVNEVAKLSNSYTNHGKIHFFTIYPHCSNHDCYDIIRQTKPEIVIPIGYIDAKAVPVVSVNSILPPKTAESENFNKHKTISSKKNKNNSDFTHQDVSKISKVLGKGIIKPVEQPYISNPVHKKDLKRSCDKRPLDESTEQPPLKKLRDPKDAPLNKPDKTPSKEIPEEESISSSCNSNNDKQMHKINVNNDKRFISVNNVIDSIKESNSFASLNPSNNITTPAILKLFSPLPSENTSSSELVETAKSSRIIEIPLLKKRLVIETPVKMPDKGIKTPDKVIETPVKLSHKDIETSVNLSDKDIESPVKLPNEVIEPPVKLPNKVIESPVKLPDKDKNLPLINYEDDHSSSRLAHGISAEIKSNNSTENNSSEKSQEAPALTVESHSNSIRLYSADSSLSSMVSVKSPDFSIILNDHQYAVPVQNLLRPEFRDQATDGVELNSNTSLPSPELKNKFTEKSSLLSSPDPDEVGKSSETESCSTRAHQEEEFTGIVKEIVLDTFCDNISTKNSSESIPTQSVACTPNIESSSNSLSTLPPFSKNPKIIKLVKSLKSDNVKSSQRHIIKIISINNRERIKLDSPPLRKEPLIINKDNKNVHQSVFTKVMNEPSLFLKNKNTPLEVDISAQAAPLVKKDADLKVNISNSKQLTVGIVNSATNQRNILLNNRCNSASLNNVPSEVEQLNILRKPRNEEIVCFPTDMEDIEKDHKLISDASYKGDPKSVGREESTDKSGSDSCQNRLPYVPPNVIEITRTSSDSSDDDFIGKEFQTSIKTKPINSEISFSGSFKTPENDNEDNISRTNNHLGVNTQTSDESIIEVITTYIKPPRKCLNALSEEKSNDGSLDKSFNSNKADGSSEFEKSKNSRRRRKKKSPWIRNVRSKKKPFQWNSVAKKESSLRGAESSCYGSDYDSASDATTSSWNTMNPMDVYGTILEKDFRGSVTLYIDNSPEIIKTRKQFINSLHRSKSESDLLKAHKIDKELVVSIPKKLTYSSYKYDESKNGYVPIIEETNSDKEESSYKRDACKYSKKRKTKRYSSKRRRKRKNCVKIDSLPVPATTNANVVNTNTTQSLSETESFHYHYDSDDQTGYEFFEPPASPPTPDRGLLPVLISPDRDDTSSNCGLVIAKVESLDNRDVVFNFDQKSRCRTVPVIELRDEEDSDSVYEFIDLSEAELSEEDQITTKHLQTMSKKVVCLDSKEAENNSNIDKSASAGEFSPCDENTFSTNSAQIIKSTITDLQVNSPPVKSEETIYLKKEATSDQPSEECISGSYTEKNYSMVAPEEKLPSNHEEDSLVSMHSSLDNKPNIIHQDLVTDNGNVENVDRSLDKQLISGAAVAKESSIESEKSKQVKKRRIRNAVDQGLIIDFSKGRPKRHGKQRNLFLSLQKLKSGKRIKAGVKGKQAVIHPSTDNQVEKDSCSVADKCDDLTRHSVEINELSYTNTLNGNPKPIYPTDFCRSNSPLDDFKIENIDMKANEDYAVDLFDRELASLAIEFFELAPERISYEKPGQKRPTLKMPPKLKKKTK